MSCQSRCWERTTPRCLVHGTMSIASLSMRSMQLVGMAVSEVIILVFAWPKRPRQEIAQFLADVTASWSGNSDTSWLWWWAWCESAQDICRIILSFTGWTRPPETLADMTAPSRVWARGTWRHLKITCMIAPSTVSAQRQALSHRSWRTWTSTVQANARVSTRHGKITTERGRKKIAS